MKHTIEIECPEGYKPIYNKESGKVEIIPDSIMNRVKTFEDAAYILGGIKTIKKGIDNKSVQALSQLHVILEVLNEGYRFDLTKGEIWYPSVRIYKKCPQIYKVIGRFIYHNEIYELAGGIAANKGHDGLASWDSSYEIGYSYASTSLIACKSKEIAEYVSTQFGKLIFEACYARHFDNNEFRWLD